MSKFSQLKWIPMLIKAYSDIQVNKALEAQKQDFNPIDARVIAEHQPEVEQIKKPKIPLKPKKTKQVKSSLSTPSKPRPVTVPHNYNSIIHELRETKTKLNRLESIHEQLQQMEMQMDVRLEEIIKRVMHQYAQEFESVRKRPEPRHSPPPSHFM